MAELAQAETQQGVAIGDWFKDAVFWLVENGSRVLDPPDDFTRWMVREFIGEDNQPGHLVDLAWYMWPLAFFVVALVARRPHRGLRAALALIFVRSLGEQIWENVPQSLAMILIGVAMGVVLALPIALAALLSTGLRRIIRRLGDTSQLLLLTGYSIPLVFIFGLGASPALWVIALASVVPMSRAMVAGADLARERPKAALGALAGGLNTSTLLAVWLQGGLALIGAGGVGRLIFRASNNLNLALYFTAAIALLAVGIAFDQVTRPIAHREGAFLDRTHHAWNVAITSETSTPIPPTYLRTAPATVVGAAVTFVSLLLPWSTDRATVTSHVREADLNIPGASFNGIHELGGGGFGLAIGTLASCALVGVLLRATRRNGPPADFTSVIGAAISVIALAFLITTPAPFAESSNISIGAIGALVGGVIILVGSILQTGGGAWSDIDPSARLGYFMTLLGLIIAGGLVVFGSTLGWVVDLDPVRPESVSAASIDAEIERLREEAGDDINKQITNAQLIQNLINESQPNDGEPSHIGGLHVDGPHTAFVVLAAAGLAVLLTIAVAFGVERARWLAMGLAFGAALTAGAWIVTTSSVDTDATLRSDGGPFIALIGAASLMAIARRAPIRTKAVVAEPEGESVSEDIPTILAPPEVSPELGAEPEEVDIQSRAEALLSESSQ